MKNLNNLTFVIVEDNISTAEVYKLILKKQYPGCEVEVYYDGKSAIERIPSNNFDLLITDINLQKDGRYNGWCVAQAGYQVGKPVLIVSGMGIFGYMKLYTKYFHMAINRIKYIQKPFPNNIFIMKINKLLRLGITETAQMKRSMSKLKNYI